MLGIGGGMQATRAAAASIAREHSPAYASARASSPARAARVDEPLQAVPTADPLSAALDKIRAGLDELRALDSLDLSDDELGDGIAGLVDVQTSLAAQEARLLADFERRSAFAADACMTANSWLAFRTSLSHAEGKRRMRRAKVLARMPRLAAALDDASISANHVDAIALRAIPHRIDVITEHDETLTDLAKQSHPGNVALAVKQIVELIDRDGTEDPPECREDDLREVRLRKGFGSLSTLSGSTTQLLTELLQRAIDAFGTPDDADTSPDQRRTPAQRAHDALLAALAAALDHRSCGNSTVVRGVHVHANVFVDLMTLLGRDDLATITPRLSRTGGITHEMARHLIATTNPTTRMILALGPWMPISVGRSRRVLPPWLRAASEATHQHCRAPGCDRPFAWTEADHLHDYAKGGETALFNDAPMCKPHHKLKTKDGWIVTFDVQTGVVTWRSRDGTRTLTVPPPCP